MNILITGGSGFIGSHVIPPLLAQGHKVIVFCRSILKSQMILGTEVTCVDQLDNVTSPIDIVINLAGEPIMGARWSAQRKQQLLDSRVGVTHKLISWISTLEKKPALLISGSAIGYYGNYPEDQALDESASPRSCFPSELCKEWEFEALKAQSFGIRVCLLRTGVVLDKHAGALQKMWLPFKLGLGGNVASGKQWFSWIHIHDMVQLILYLIENKDIQGPVNATAPHPVTYNEFTRTLANTLSRPHLFPMPKAVLNLLFGESAQLLTEGQKVVPQVLLEQGFSFRFSRVDDALRDIGGSR